MDTEKHPTLGNGKICYIGIPSTNTEKSAEFYKNVLGWRIGRNEKGEISFYDGVTEVSGTWHENRKPSVESGFVISILITDIAKTLELVTQFGGQIDKREDNSLANIARVFDPSGNMIILRQTK